MNPAASHGTGIDSAVAGVEPPVFFFNGTDDKLVPIEWSKSCHEALKTCGVKTEMHSIEGAGHLAAAMNPAALEKAYSFLQSELQIDASTAE